jgi:hypothetical protein
MAQVASGGFEMRVTTASHGGRWGAAGSAMLLAALLAAADRGSVDVHAQGRGATGRAPATRAFSSIPEMTGVWSNAAEGRCVPNGRNCPFKVEELPLNARAVAHWQVFDEPLEPKYDCVPATSPGIIQDPYMSEIQQLPDRVIIRYEKDDVTRTAWLDGRQPKANEYSWQGHSVARYEGNALIVETTHFLYDPGGLDDQGGLASSHKKRVVERYWREGDILHAEITTEDPLFLAEPVKFETVWKLAPRGTKLATFDCDPEQASHPLRFMPKKYPDGRATIPDVSVGPPAYRGLGEEK